MKIFNLVIRRPEKRSTEVWVVSFTYDENSISNPEETLRAAIQEYLATPDGKKAREYACGDFNWGDAMSSVPDEIFVKRGLIPVRENSVDCEVEHDEVLDLGNYNGGDTQSVEIPANKCDWCSNDCKALCFCEENMEDSNVCSKCSCWECDECRMDNGGCNHFKNGVSVPSDEEKEDAAGE